MICIYKALEDQTDIQLSILDKDVPCLISLSVEHIAFKLFI